MDTNNASIWMAVSLILAIALVVSIMTGGFGLVKNSNTQVVDNQTQQNNSNNEQTDEQKLIKIPVKPTNNGIAPLGSENAKVSLILFDDFQCPFCGRFYSQTGPQLEQNYINTGKVKLYFINFPLKSIHPKAMPAAEAAMCANEQGKFWEMYNKLFSNQQEWVSGNEADMFNKYAEELGLNTEQFSNCYSSNKYETIINNDFSYAASGFAGGTPTLYLIVPKDMATEAFLTNAQTLHNQYPQNIILGESEDGNNYVVGMVGALPYSMFDQLLSNINY